MTYAPSPRKESHQNQTSSNHHATLYIVDTNVLHLWASFCPDAPPPAWSQQDPDSWERLQKRQERAASFCQDPTNLLLIPGIVWVELYGVFLQKDIDIDNYEQWRRQRKAALQPIESLLLDPRSHIKLGDAPIASDLAVDFCRHPASATLQQALRDMYQKRDLPNGRIVTPKCLDGIDAAIVAYAWQYAKQYPWRAVRILSDDQGIRLMIEEMHHLQYILNTPVPKNLGYRSIWGKPTPRTHQLSFAVFLDPKDREARQLFRSGDYEAAAACWDELQHKSSDPRPHQICADIAKSYAAWEQFDWSQALHFLNLANKRLQQYQPDPKSWPLGLDLHHRDLLQQQEILLQTLQQAAQICHKDMTASFSLLQNPAQLFPLLRDLYAHAVRRFHQKQYNVAALLFYRIIEMLAQRRLATHNIDSADPHYENLAISAQSLLASVNQARDKIQATPLSELPDKIDMINDYAILLALEDPYTQGLQFQKMVGIMKTRNVSLYAHGFQFIKADTAQRMYKEVESRLQQFWKSENLDPSTSSRAEHIHTFLPLPLGHHEISAP